MLRRHEITPLIDAVLETTQPGSISIQQDHLVVAFGFLGRSRRLLRALQTLDDAGLRDCGDGLVRSIFEYVTTGAWLLMDPATNMETMLRAHARDLRLLAEGRPERYETWLQRVKDSIAEEYGDPGREAKLPRIDQRGPAILRVRYWAYRELSTRMHPGVYNAMAALEALEDEKYIPVDEPWPEQDFEMGYLVYAGMLVGGYALQVFSLVSPERVDPLMKLLDQFIEYFKARKAGWWMIG